MSPRMTVRALWVGYLVLTAYWMFRLWGHFPAFMDTLEYVFPEKWFNVESFREGRLPLWNPYLACGTPHVANLQSAAFYPFFWFWNFTGLTDWIFVVALLHGILAAAGFTLWLRALKVPSVPASLCGLSFAGSALLVSYWGFPTHLASIAWVPWIFWGAVRLRQDPSLARWGLLSLFWSFQILAGYPFFTFYAGLFLAVFIRFRSKGTPRMLLAQASAGAAALSATACQWLPFVDFMGYLRREGWGDNLFSLHWVNFLTLLQPHWLGVPGTAGYKGDYPNFIFNNLYLGLVPLGLFLWSFFSAQSRDDFWKRSALFWLLWLAGIHFFLWRILPGGLLDKLEPSKASFLFLFCAFTATALFLRDKIEFTSRKNHLWTWAWILGVLWMADIAAVPYRVIQTVPDPFRDSEVMGAAEKAKRLAGEGRMVSLREENQFYPPHVGSFADSLKETAKVLIPNTNVIWGIRSARGYLSIYTDGFQNINRYLRKGYPYEGRVLDAAGVKLMVFPRPLPAFKYSLHEREGESFFIRNAGAMNNAWTTAQAREFPGRPEVLNALLDPKAFLEREVFTEKAVDGKAVRLEPVRRPLPGYQGPSFLDRLESFGKKLFGEREALRGRRLSPCEARFVIPSSAGGFLVFGESFSPGWHAWVDGEPKAIFRADGSWMAVVFSGPGDHQVCFRYEPSCVRLGLFITLLSIAAALAAWVLSWKRLWSRFSGFFPSFTP